MLEDARRIALLPKGIDPRLAPAAFARFRLTAAILAGGVAAACFGSRILLQEIDSRPDMPGYATLRPVAATWHGAMQHLGIAASDHALHDGIRAAEAVRFPNDR